MFIRLSLLRHNARPHIKWQKQILCPSELKVKQRTFQRFCSDIKRNEDLLFSRNGAGIVIPSPLRIKQTIKTGFYDYIDGPTCVQTSCPTCPPSPPQEISTITDGKTTDHNKKEKCLFINKTTGKIKDEFKQFYFENLIRDFVF